MKFLFVARNPSLFIQYEHVIKGLIRGGHTVEFHLVSMKWRNAKMDTKILEDYNKETEGSFSYREAYIPSGIRSGILQHKREIVNYAAYFREDNPISISPYMMDRQRLALFPPMHILLLNRIFQKYVLKKNRIQKLSFVERCIAPDLGISQLLGEIGPDIVIASPFIFSRSSVEMEYIKCAKKLSIPSSVPIFSWDNLTSKGLFQIIPDSVLVWNEKQIVELEEIHDVDPEKVLATGAPSLDGWFEQRPQYIFQEFCTKYELNQKPYVLYLCSSHTIARDEHIFVEKLVTYLNEKLGENCPTVVVRPHPLNIAIWDGWSKEGSVVVPKSSRNIFYSKDAKNLMFESIYHSSCVVGLNTTAMIETAIIGKPCFSIIVDKYSNTQEKSGHFHHLSEAGFMHSTRTMEELAMRISAAVDGEDDCKDAREKFIVSFIRPTGSNVNSSMVMQNCLEQLAKGIDVAAVKQCLINHQEGC